MLVFFVHKFSFDVFGQINMVSHVTLNTKVVRVNVDFAWSLAVRYQKFRAYTTN
jgi:hypothetical protein